MPRRPGAGGGCPVELLDRVGALGSADRVAARRRAYHEPGADCLAVVPVTAEDPGRWTGPRVLCRGVRCIGRVLDVRQRQARGTALPLSDSSCGPLASMLHHISAPLAPAARDAHPQWQEMVDQPPATAGCTGLDERFVIHHYAARHAKPLRRKVSDDSQIREPSQGSVTGMCDQTPGGGGARHRSVDISRHSSPAPLPPATSASWAVTTRRRVHSPRK